MDKASLLPPPDFRKTILVHSQSGETKAHFCAFYKATCYYNPLEHAAVLIPSLAIWERSTFQGSLSRLVLHEIPWKLESCSSAYRTVLCACVCALVLMHVEARGQLRFSFLRCCPNWFLFKGIIGMVVNRLCRLYWLLNETRRSIWLPPQCWDCKLSHCHCRFLLMWVLGGETWIFLSAKSALSWNTELPL